MANTVYFMSARIDEHGNARGGKAGDQNGREVMIQPYYDHKDDGGWVVVRAKSPEVAEKIAQNMEYACANDLIGYDQNQRDTLMDAVKPVGYNCSLLKKAVETDCSALVRVALAYAGRLIDTGKERFYTGNEVRFLMSTGMFDLLTSVKYTKSPNYLRRGDILCTARPGHTGVIRNDGKYADETASPILQIAAPATPADSFNANWIIATGDVNVRTGPGTKYAKKIVLPKGVGLMYYGAVNGEWYAVMYRGMKLWVSSRYTKVAVYEKPIIDLSQYNRVQDWSELSKWISSAILRVGIRTLLSNGPIKQDKLFEDHAANCVKYEIPLSVYFYGRAKTVAGAQEEAAAAIKWAKKYNPVVYFYDVEQPTSTQQSVQAFIDYIRANAGGAAAGTYIGQRWRQVNGDKLDRDIQWSPYYNDNTANMLFAGRNPSHRHDVHQTTSSSRFPGSASNIDMSHINADAATVYKGWTIKQFLTGKKAA